MRFVPHALAAAALAAVLSGCGATQIVGAVYFNLSVSESSLSVKRGESGTVNVNVLRLSPIAANIDLTLKDAPAGITADKVTVGGMETTKPLVLHVAADAPEGTVPLTIEGRNLAYGQTAQVNLTVNP